MADPLASVRAAMAEVERGKFDTRVQVHDASEIGLLRAGFNRMAAGLEERERVRDLFGRQVAQAALDGEVELGAEVRDVAVLFVDVVGSTTLAARRPPEEVVELLNRFFGVVVEVTEELPEMDAGIGVSAGGRRQRRGRGALRVHGDRRSGQRGGAAVRPRRRRSESWHPTRRSSGPGPRSASTGP